VSTEGDRLAEQWFRLLADAAHGSGQAREAMEAFAKVSSPADFSGWLARFMPGASSSDAPATFEQWWEMMGVVPRARYQKLLEHSERLRAKLEEADKTIAQLRETLTAGGQNEPVARILSEWEAAMRAGVKSYSEWLEAWSQSMKPPPGQKPKN
jgi:hypothetical protein